jgi:hypothetical protein
MRVTVAVAETAVSYVLPAVIVIETTGDAIGGAV